MIDETSTYKGRVVAKKANFYVVQIDVNHAHWSAKNVSQSDSYVRFLCTVRRRIIYSGTVIYVGDYVVIGSIDWQANRAIIINLEPRTSLLGRPPVANISEVVVVLSVKNPDFYVEQASRFLLIAERSKVKIGLILTKIDLISNQELILLIERLKGWGYTPLAVSIKTGEGVRKVIKQFENSNLSVLCGPSGVGKSSLINLIIPNEIIATGGLSKKLQRGKHTTRHVQLYSLKEGSLVADTPGFNIPALDLESYDLQFLFPELRNQLESIDSCRFRDCLHCNEPGCIIDKDWERYPHYIKYLEENINFRRLSQED